MRKLIVIALLTLFIAAAGRAFDENTLIELFLDDPHAKAMTEYYMDATPEILLVALDPMYPAAGDPVQVRANIKPHPDMSPYKTERAELHYTLDGEAFELVEMQQAADGFWEAVIPGQDSGAFVRYYIRAWDESGNSVVQLPRRLGMELTDDSGYIRMIVDPEEPEPHPTNNFLGIGFATDGQFLFFRVETAGPARPTMAGGDLYLKGLSTHAADLRYWDTYSGMSFGTNQPAIIYAPNPFKSFMGLYKIDSILGEGGPLAEVQFRDRGNVLYGKVAIADLTATPIQGYPIFAISAILNLAEQKVAIQDGTNHCMIYFDGDYYIVE